MTAPPPLPRLATLLGVARLIPFVLIVGCSAHAVNPLSVQWELLQGPYARNITTLHVSPGENLLFAGLANGELSMSTDGGRSWAYRTPPSPGEPVLRFFDDPVAKTMLYAAGPAGFFRSTDSARTWKQIAPEFSGVPVRPVYAFGVDPWKPEIRFLGTGGHGLFRSTDSGITWAQVEDSIVAGAEVQDIVIDAQHPDRIFASLGPRGIVRSEDGGASWADLTSDASTAGQRVTAMLVHAKDGNLVLYGTDGGSIYRSSNAGEHWSPVRPAGLGDALLSFWADPGKPNTVLAGTQLGILQSTDFGERWRPLEGSLPRVPVTLAASPAQSNHLFGYSEAIGVQFSADGGLSWTSADTSLGGVVPKMLVADPGSKDLLMIAGRALLRYVANTSTWVTAGGGLTGGHLLSLAVDPRSATTLFATSTTGAFRSTDGGSSWHEFARTLPNAPRVLVPHPWFPTRLLASGGRGIFVSTDRGRTWKESRPPGKLPSAFSFTFRMTNAGNILAAADGPAVLHTLDGGITWEATRYGLGTDTLSFISLDDADDQVCYAWTTAGGCYRSIDGGLEWSRFTPPWTVRDRVRLAVDPENASRLVALVNDRTVMLSTTGGTTWHTVFDMKLPGVPAALAWHAGSSTLYVGLRDRGVYRLRLNTVVQRLPDARPE